MFHHSNLIGYQELFNHCASIAVVNNNPIIVGYCGQECTDEQRVFIYYKGRYKLLRKKTGNPIIWVHQKKINLLYSEFEDIAPDGSRPLSPVERWKYCSNHHVQFKISDLALNQDIESKSSKIDSMFGLLARCQPVVYNNDLLIPMYREKNPRCEIWSMDNDNKFFIKGMFGEMDNNSAYNFKATSSLGIGAAIQPTIGITKDGLVALNRNVSRDHKNAWISRSNDGVTWSMIEQSTVPNENNSLVYINNEEERHKYLVYNTSRDRSDIRLYNFMKKQSIQLGTPLVGYGRLSYSYPNYIWDVNDLHIVHSNCGMIAHHVFSKEYLEKAFDL
ncbi:hypothetical protein CCP1ISM_90007 [Azospirillaceae bacterium]